MNGRRREAADVGVVVAAVGAAALFSVAYSAIAGRQLGPAAFSDFAGGIALATVLSVALGALAPITAHLTARYAAAGQYARIRGLIARLLRVIAAIVVAVLIAGAILAIPIARALQFSSPWIVPAAVLVFGGLAIGAVTRAALRGAQRFGAYGANLVAEAAVRLMIGAVVLNLAPSAVNGVLAYAIAMVVVVPVAYRLVSRLADAVEPVDLSEVTSMLGAMAVLLGAMAVYGNVDLIIVKRFFDPEQAGIYGAAATLARSMVVVVMPLEALLVPRLTYVAGERANGGGVRRVVLLAGAVAFLPLAVFAAAPTTIIRLLYGPAFAPAGRLLFPLAGSLLAVCFAYLAGQVLVSISRPRSVLFFALGVVVEVGLLLVFGRSLETVVSILVLTRSAVLAVMLIALLRSRRSVPAPPSA